MVWETICQQCHWSPSWLQTGLYPELQSPTSSNLVNLEQVPWRSNAFCPTLHLVVKVPSVICLQPWACANIPLPKLETRRIQCSAEIDWHRSSFIDTRQTVMNVSEGLVKQERAATGRNVEMFWEMFLKKFKPSIVALYAFMADKCMCPAVSLDRLFRMAHRNILFWGSRCFHNFTTDFKK